MYLYRGQMGDDHLFSWCISGHVVFLEGIQNPKGKQKTTLENAHAFGPVVRNCQICSSLPNAQTCPNKQNREHLRSTGIASNIS